MSTNTFSIKETVKVAWSLVFGTKITFSIVLILITAAQYVTILCNIGINFFTTSVAVIAILQVLKIMGIILSFILTWGLTYLGALRVSQDTIHYKQIADLFSIYLVLKMIGLHILEFLIMLPAAGIAFLPYIMDIQDKHMAGFFMSICLVISTVAMLHLAMRLYVASIMVITDGANPWVAVKLSFHLTYRQTWKLFKLTVINLLILIVSAIPLGIGLLWSIPYFYINYGLVYQSLMSLQNQVSPTLDNS